MRQKWKSILFILLIGVYLYEFVRILNWFSISNNLVIDLLDRASILGLIGFLFAYALIAILVNLFNLPTSSVFEQKIKEAIDFQKLSQSVSGEKSNSETYETLIDSTMSAVFCQCSMAGDW